MKAEDRWKRRSRKMLKRQFGSVNVEATLVPSKVWCKGAKSKLHWHQIVVSKVYRVKTRKGKILRYVICPVHNTLIKV